MELRFFDDPATFLEVAGTTLAEQPVLSTVIAGIAERVRAQREAGIAWPDGVPCWFAAVLDGDDVSRDIEERDRVVEEAQLHAPTLGGARPSRPPV